MEWKLPVHQLIIFTWHMSDWCAYTYEEIRGIRTAVLKTETTPGAGRRRAHGRGRFRQSRERWARWERRASTIPKGGPHLELRRSRLKTWSKSNFSIAQTTGPIYLHIFICLQGGLCRGGLTPALAPRMPVITKDVGKSRSLIRHNSTANGYIKKLIAF